jgi:hypothetical protein
MAHTSVIVNTEVQQQLDGRDRKVITFVLHYLISCMSVTQH